ncbi:MAG: putative Ig domain-containing protein [Nitrosopumilus sp.]|nr:putative Ig domain-containing protein [Nitrosopumilus sp.]MDH3340744.1 putative Ig domain-containing protein [Nitrosopumilus sp.]
MLTKLALLIVFGISLVIVTPSYADVKSLSLEKSFYTNDEKIEFVGIEEDGLQQVSVVIKRNGDTITLLGDPASDEDGTFSTIPRLVEDIFTSKGVYEAIAFTSTQKVEDGMILNLEYDGERVAEVPDFVLQLKTIGDKLVEVEKTITFTASLIDSSITDVAYSLKNAPSGATIDSKTGKFVWTPSKSHGNIQDVPYNFDVIANKGGQEDKENVTITVKQAYQEPKQTEPEPKQTEPEPKQTEPEPKQTEPEPKQTEPEPKQTEPKELGIAVFVDKTKDPQSYVDRYNNEATYKKWFDENFPEYDSIYQAVGLEEPLQIPALFVDKTKDPQSYVDRYNNEGTYKKWFDENFPEYDSIYQAVGLEEPKELAPFVDPDLDPQYYIDRYNNEGTYKKWFDETYPNITIYDAVGIQEPEFEEPEFGECGEGTDLVDGMCMIVDNSEGGGCLIATATYGTEMAPQVQLLREIRDNQLMNTDSGTSFMTGFNQLYYSFSPTIADMERENPVFREAVKIGITPLLSSLSILSFADSESKIIGYGIGVILMNLGLYVAVPALLIYKGKKFIRL